MVDGTVEERLLALETEVKRLKRQMQRVTAAADLPWWEQIVGTFADCPAFEEAVRLGEAWRNADRPEPDEDHSVEDQTA